MIENQLIRQGGLIADITRPRGDTVLSGDVFLDTWESELLIDAPLEDAEPKIAPDDEPLLESEAKEMDVLQTDPGHELKIQGDIGIQSIVPVKPEPDAKEETQKFEPGSRPDKPAELQSSTPRAIEQDSPESHGQISTGVSGEKHQSSDDFATPPATEVERVASPLMAAQPLNLHDVEVLQHKRATVLSDAHFGHAPRMGERPLPLIAQSQSDQGRKSTQGPARPIEIEGKSEAVGPSEHQVSRPSFPSAPMHLSTPFPTHSIAPQNLMSAFSEPPSDVEDGLSQLTGPPPTQHAVGTHTQPTLMPPRAPAGQVVQQVAQAVAQSQGATTQISLNPEELGRVRIALTTHETGVVVNILAERAETSDLLRRNLDSLLQEFRDLGYDSPHFSFDRGHDNETDGSGAAEFGEPSPTATDPQHAGQGDVRRTGSDTGLDLKL